MSASAGQDRASVHAVPARRPSRGRQDHHGATTPELPWLLLLTMGVTAVALVTWQHVCNGQLPQGYVDAAAGRPLWLLVLGGAGFSLLNAAVEEAIFRGVLQTAVQRVSGPAVAIAAGRWVRRPALPRDPERHHRRSHGRLPGLAPRCPALAHPGTAGALRRAHRRRRDDLPHASARPHLRSWPATGREAVPEADRLAGRGGTQSDLASSGSCTRGLWHDDLSCAPVR